MDAWIEILVSELDPYAVTCRILMDAWIEISLAIASGTSDGVASSRMRGLK